MHDEHVGENAELYALGQLDELEAGRVERHARTCDECAERLGEAEASVLRLIELGGAETAPPAQLDRRVRFSAPPPYAWIAAVAAAFLLGVLPWGVTALRHSNAETSANQQLAMNAMLAGHFLHAPAVALISGAPAAKVIYPREGGWLYVLVGPANQRIDVVAVAGTQRTTIASVEPGAQTRAAFVKTAQRVSAIELVEGGAVVSKARIAYASRP